MRRISAVAVCVAVCLFSAGSRAGSTQAEAADSARLTFTIEYQLIAPGGTRSVEFTCLVPRSITGRQTIHVIRYSQPPVSVFEVGDNRYARFRIDKTSATSIRIDVDAELHQYDLATAIGARARRTSERDAPLSAIRGTYLAHERFLETNDRSIRAAAASIADGSELDVIRRVHEFVVNHMRYEGYVSAGRGAVRALRSGAGDCSEYADLMATMLRARGIPARTVEGYVTRFTHNAKHSWVEAYSTQYGWVPLDPLLAALGAASFDHLEPIYIRLSHTLNDPVLDNYQFWHVRYWGDPVTVSDTLTVYTAGWREKRVADASLRRRGG